MIAVGQDLLGVYESSGVVVFISGSKESLGLNTCPEQKFAKRTSLL